ncbi:sodium:proline symporter, partial [Thermodesulfobacteriota bacterium]
ERRRLALGKVTTVIWGIFITGFAFVVGDISNSVIVGINKIGSAFYGPILAAFLAGVVTRRVTSRGVIAGIIAGVCFNLGLWIFTPGVFWMWWNCFGCVVTAATAFAVSLFDKSFVPSRSEGLTVRDRTDDCREKNRFAIYGWLVLYFLVILGLCLFIPGLLTGT